MKFRIKYILIKTYWFFVIPVRRIYRFTVRPNAMGVKVVITHESRVLLVRPNYGHRLWTVPGGAVERGETFEEAARREMKEEVGLKLEKLAFLGEYASTLDYVNYSVQVYIASVESPSFMVDGIEIKEANWFSPDALPSDRTPRVEKILGLYKGASS